MSRNQTPDLMFSQLLRSEYLSRKSRNPRFSIRAFAKYLGVSKTSLADTLADRRELSRTNVIRISNRLDLSPEQTRRFLADRIPATLSADGMDFLRIDAGVFSVMSNWYYLAILNLAKLPNTSEDPGYIARRLGIDRLEASLAIQCLSKLGMLTISHGRLRRTCKPVTTSSETPCASIRKYHRQNLHLAEESLERDPMELRDFSSATMPVGISRLKEAKQKIARFREDMAEFLESGKCSEVYSLAIQLFPVTRRNRT